MEIGIERSAETISANAASPLLDYIPVAIQQEKLRLHAKTQRAFELIIGRIINIEKRKFDLVVIFSF